MFKYCSILLLFTIFHRLIVSFAFNGTIKNHEEYDNVDILNNVATLLEKCNFGLKNIVIIHDGYNNNYSTFESTMSTMQPPIPITIMTSTINKPVIDQLDHIGIDGIILNLKEDVQWESIIRDIYENFLYIKNCTLIVIPISSKCTKESEILIHLTQLYIFNAYYACQSDDNVTVIYTHDPWGDTQPPFWQKIEQQLVGVNNWTLYQRFFEDADICQGFSFDRVNNPTILLGIRMHNLENGSSFLEYNLYDDNIEEYFIKANKENIYALKSLTKYNFKYYIGPYDKYYDYMFDNTSADILHGLFVDYISDNWRLCQPLDYDTLAVLSHNRGFNTPLEKIAKFYGRWTLISLIIILTMAFSVILLETNKNISYAIFESIRLLINTGIYLPINTLPLRIFFCAIFLYFLIIHSTFSGNLAKFLTKPELQKNVDSIDDLRDSRIKRIYCFAYRYENLEDVEVLQNKSTQAYLIDECTVPVFTQQNSACIALLRAMEIEVSRTENGSFYISKDRFFTYHSGPLYRNKLPFLERYSWAIMTAVETGILNRQRIIVHRNARETLLKKAIRSEMKFRAISFRDLNFTFISLTIGNGLGLICFIYEMLIGRNHRKHRIKKRCYIRPLRAGYVEYDGLKYMHRNKGKHPN